MPGNMKLGLIMHSGMSGNLGYNGMASLTNADHELDTSVMSTGRLSSYWECHVDFIVGLSTLALEIHS